MKSKEVESFQHGLSGQSCPECKSPSLNADDAEDIVEEFAEAATEANADVEIISSETEEGQMLKNSFGGIAAILRFRP